MAEKKKKQEKQQEVSSPGVHDYSHLFRKRAQTQMKKRPVKEDPNSNFKVNAYEMWMKIANRNKSKSLSRTSSISDIAASKSQSRFFNQRGNTITKMTETKTAAMPNIFKQMG